MYCLVASIFFRYEKCSDSTHRQKQEDTKAEGSREFSFDSLKGYPLNLHFAHRILITNAPNRTSISGCRDFMLDATKLSCHSTNWRRSHLPITLPWNVKGLLELLFKESRSNRTVTKLSDLRIIVWNLSRNKNGRIHFAMSETRCKK